MVKKQLDNPGAPLGIIFSGRVVPSMHVASPSATTGILWCLFNARKLEIWRFVGAAAPMGREGGGGGVPLLFGTCLRFKFFKFPSYASKIMRLVCYFLVHWSTGQGTWNRCNTYRFLMEMGT